MSCSAKAVADIHRHTIGKRIETVPLAACSPIHAIDRPTALATLQKRTRQVIRHKQRILLSGVIDEALLAEILPSVSRIHGVRVGRQIVTFEGNGRLLALQKALKNASSVQLSVVIHQVDAPDKIIRRVNRTRRFNDLQLIDHDHEDYLGSGLKTVFEHSGAVFVSSKAA